MPRDTPELIELPEPEQLPAPPAVVIEALSPMLSERRRARIEEVIAQRTRRVLPVLDGLADPHNNAAVLRSADAFGCQEVHVIGGPAELGASPRVTQGAERWVDLVRHDSAEACAGALHRRGYRIYVATMGGVLGPDALRAEPRVAIVFGNEHSGVSRAMQRLADGSYAVPMRGFSESLNVSVAAAITLFEATCDRAGELSESERERLRARFMMLSIKDAHRILDGYVDRAQR